jgi:hypothetical protein
MTTVTGGCLCGAVRYEYEGVVGAAAYCHCADCRRVSGSAFGVSVSVEADKLTFLSGTLGHFTTIADSGSQVTRYFCTGCGSPIYTLPPHRPGIVFIKAGSLDDPSLVTPNRQAWVSSAVPWHVIPPDLPSFEKGRT